MTHALHAKLSASGAHRWMACPASVHMEENMPDRESKFAREGTAAHSLAEQCLRSGLHANNYLKDNVEGIIVSSEMIEAVQLYLDYVRDIPGGLLIEQRVDFSPYVPGGFGTADAIILASDTATLIDFKYGKGVKIEAEDNPQTLLYGLGVLNSFDFLGDYENFVISIVQPRLDHISEWSISRSELLEFAAKAREKAQLALGGNAPFVPGEIQCRFCKAQGTCRVLAQHNLDLAREGFSKQLKNPNKLDLDEIAELLPQLPNISNWIKAVEAHALQQLHAGQNLPGFKLVEARSRRQWIDEETVIEALRTELEEEKIFIKKLISPAQAEKRLGRKHEILENYTTKPTGLSTIAPTSDPRPVLNLDPLIGFEQAA